MARPCPLRRAGSVASSATSGGVNFHDAFLPKCAADLTYDGVMALPAKPAAARRCASPASEQTPDRLTVPGIGFPAAAASAQSRAGLRHTGNKIFWLVIKWKIEIDRSQPGGLRAYSA